MAVVTEISDDDTTQQFAALQDQGQQQDNGFFGSLVGSVFEPGVNKSLFQAMNFSFLALILTLLGMAFLTNFNKHVLFLMAVSTGLWMTMIWFVAEISKVQTSPQNAPPPTDGTIPSVPKPDLLSSQGKSSAKEDDVQARQRKI